MKGDENAKYLYIFR